MSGSWVFLGGEFQRLGDEYFSWWSVQHMLPYGTGFLTFMHLCNIFNLQFVLSILFYNFFKSGIETLDRNSQWYQHLLTVFAIV